MTGGEITSRSVRLMDRIRARVSARDLDHQLAGGASPDASVLVAVHAGSILRPPARLVLAHSLRRVAHLAETPAAVPRPRTPICRAHAVAVTADLRALADGSHCPDRSHPRQ